MCVHSSVVHTPLQTAFIISWAQNPVLSYMGHSTALFIMTPLPKYRYYFTKSVPNNLNNLPNRSSAFWKSRTYSNLLTLLTPWSRVLLEKLTGFAANQEIPRILWNPKVYYRTHKRLLLHDASSRNTPPLEITYSNLPPVMSHTTMCTNFLQPLQVFTQFAVQVTGRELLNIKRQDTVHNLIYKMASQSRQHVNMLNRNTYCINSFCISVW